MNHLDSVPSRSTATVAEQICRHFRKGSKFASIALAYIGVVAIVTRGANLRAIQLPLWALPVFFYGSAASAAVVLGLLAQAQVGRVRSMMVAALALYLPLLALSAILYPDWDLPTRLVGMLIGAVVMAVPYGDILWRARGGGDASG